jgi:hypothetical protein
LSLTGRESEVARLVAAGLTNVRSRGFTSAHESTGV